LAAATGDYASAIKRISYLTGYRVAIAEASRAAGYAEGPRYGYPNFYTDVTLPYTVGVGFDQDRADYAPLPPAFTDSVDQPAHAAYGRLGTPPLEQRFFQLAQGEFMLAWADQLYRNDDPSSIRRARELYKGVIFMHGEDPEIAPHFGRGRLIFPLP